MQAIDSSGWIAYFRDEPTADFFAAAIKDLELVVPSIVMYEVYKILRRSGADRRADLAAAQMKARRVVPLTDRLALAAAEVSLRHGLALADALVYATAQAVGATLLTGDEHFRGLPGVEYPPAEDPASPSRADCA
jgi:predicted nucleic acid-binding protein